MSTSPEADPTIRLVLADCPGCDEVIPMDNLQLNEQLFCPHCKSLLLLVRIDGVAMFLLEGWT
jgi:uncharacterized paraquat-inducible protein A